MDVQTLLYLLGGGAATAMATYYLIKSLFPWLKYDYQFLKSMGAILIKIKGYQRRNWLLIDIWEDRVKTMPTKTFLIFEDKRYTYEYMNKMANKVAHMALDMGLKKGDVVAMLQTNEPAFIWTYFGEFSVHYCVYFSPLLCAYIVLNWPPEDS